MKLRVTPRDEGVLTDLAGARWLTTTQIHTLRFSKVSVEMARRRLRALRKTGHVFTTQANRMAEALHSLGPQGRELLRKRGWPDALRLERRPPKNLEHFLGINDIRVAVERSARSTGLTVSFFFASWELQQHGWEWPIIPDAVCLIESEGGELTIAFEYDRGEESPEIIKTKFRRYDAGLPDLPIARVVMIADTQARMKQLRSYASRVVANQERYLFFIRDEFCRSFQLTELV